MLVFGGVYHPVNLKRTDCFPRLVKRNLTGASIEVASESSNIEGFYTRGHYITHFGGDQSMHGNFERFPLQNNALFGLVSYNDTCILSQVDLGFCATTTRALVLGFCVFFSKPRQNP